MPSLLFRALEETAAGLLVLTPSGIIVDINENAKIWFSGLLTKGDDVRRDLRTPEGGELDLSDSSHGVFPFGRAYFRYFCRHFVDNGNVYLSVTIFDDTSIYSRMINAEHVANLNDAKFVKEVPLTEEPTDHEMDDFTVRCSIDAGFGFTEDENATMVKYSATGVAEKCNKLLRGFTSQELAGISAYDLIHPDDIMKTATYHKKLLDDPRPVVPVYCLLRKLHKSGHYVPTEIIGALRADGDGNRCISGLERTIVSDRSERLVSSLTDQLPCAVVVVDGATGIIEVCNSKASSWFEMKRDRNFLKHIESLEGKIFHPSARVDLIAAIRQCEGQRRRDKDRAPAEREVIVKTIQGKMFSFVGSMSVNVGGGKVGASLPPSPSVTNSSNINMSTSDVLLEVEEHDDSSSGSSEASAPVMDAIVDDKMIWVINDVSHMNDTLEEQHSAIVKFMRCTSHQMRTPMQAISLAAHSLSESIGDAKADIDTIISCSVILETIMSNIFEFKNISAMTLDPIFKAFDVRLIVERVVEVLRNSTILSSGVTLSCNILWEGVEYINIDCQMLERILFNLAANSLKFTTKGSVTVEASLERVSCAESTSADEDDNISSQDRDVILHIKVIDTGCGMNAETQAKIGEYDFSDQSGVVSGIYQGFGLGTYIVRNYTQALGGTFTLQSEVGEGTTICIDIPTTLAEEEIEQFKIGTILRRASASPQGDLTPKSWKEAPEASKEIAQETEVASAPVQRKLKVKVPKASSTPAESCFDGKVLVVEDVTINRKLIVKALERGGFTVDQAENGAIGLDMMLQNNYRTVFMDINMPVMDGDEAVREYWKRTTDVGLKVEVGSSRVSPLLSQHADLAFVKPAMSSHNSPQKLKKNRSINYIDESNKVHPKIVMLTGNITDADREKALACGAHEFMTKPAVPQQLWEAASWTIKEEDSPHSSNTSRESPRSTSSRGRSSTSSSVEFPTCL